MFLNDIDDKKIIIQGVIGENNYSKVTDYKLLCELVCGASRKAFSLFK